MSQSREPVTADDYDDPLFGDLLKRLDDVSQTWASDAPVECKRAASAIRQMRAERERILDNTIRLLTDRCEIHTRPRIDELTGCIVCAKGDLEAARAEVEKLRTELGHIANANPHRWEADMRGDFQPWAQSRARDAVAQSRARDAAALTKGEKA
jgi:hypothetical protein